MMSNWHLKLLELSLLPWIQLRKHARGYCKCSSAFKAFLMHKSLLVNIANKLSACFGERCGGTQGGFRHPSLNGNGSVARNQSLGEDLCFCMQVCAVSRKEHTRQSCQRAARCWIVGTWRTARTAWHFLRRSMQASLPRSGKIEGLYVAFKEPYLEYAMFYHISQNPRVNF